MVVRRGIALAVILVWSSSSLAVPRSVAGGQVGFDDVKQMAQSMAASAQQPPQRVAQPFLNLTYDTYRMIAPRPENALWHDESLPFRAEFFAAGFLYEYPVEVSVVDQGVETPVEYNDHWFQYRGDALPLEHEAGNGFAGARFLNLWPGAKHMSEFLVFLGASYYRGLGEDEWYGASARGLAIDIGLPSPEEFPRFRKLWLVKPASDSKQLEVWALMDSPAVAGAYDFHITPGKSTTLDVDAYLWFRHGVQKVGIAPLTSMWMWDGVNKPANDPRPEVHDSDSLLIQDGTYKWIYRALDRPQKPRVDTWPIGELTGFGLLQRDRNYEHYHDDETFYHKRPSIWVTPTSNWGQGRVELLELPSEHEGGDNIGAYWVANDPVRGGDSRHLGYRVAFGPGPEEPAAVARVVDTRIVNESKGAAEVEIEYEQAGEANQQNVSPVVNSTGGTVESIELKSLPASRRLLRFHYSHGESDGPVEAYLESGAERVSEIWNYRWMSN